ncbi:pyridoxamine 5'-phosphate oxidase-domain-containing protein, partial [Vararia minispora EC-137]
AAFIARTVLARCAVGTMATIYPQDYSVDVLAGQPYAMQEYYATCFANGSLGLIFLPISRHSQNILRSPSHAASLSVWSEPPAASQPRVSLIGNVTILGQDDPSLDPLKECYLAQHPDARAWLPGDDEGAHKAYWARFDPHSIYFVGGFGDEHYIGYIPTDKYQSAVSPSSADSQAVLTSGEGRKELGYL